MTADSQTAPGVSPADAPTEDWYRHHFNHFSQALADHLAPTLAGMREHCPLTRSDEFNGFWIATQYRDIQRIAQDWETFSSARGVVVPHMPVEDLEIPVIPELLDPPEHGPFKQLISQYLTPAAVAEHRLETRRLIDDTIDGFIDRGHCEFMQAFADPIPGRILFERYLNAPPEDLPELIRLASIASTPISEQGLAARDQILDWVRGFVDTRRQQGGRGDMVDGLLNATINDRPITHTEVLGIIQLLIFGGLDTTAGALGNIMVRFCRQPDIPTLLREQPQLIPAAVEELLRLDSPFVCIARTVTRDTEINGRQLRAGEQVLLSWQSANHDSDVFGDALDFDPHRANSKLHMAFGTGIHRCAGSHLARLNLCLSIEAIVNRLHDIRFDDGAEPISYHPGFSRAPRQVPIRFTPAG